MASKDTNTGIIESKDDVKVDIEIKDNDCGEQNVTANSDSDASTQSNDTVIDNNESKSEEKVDEKIEDNDGGGQTPATSSTEPDVLPQPVGAISGDETNVNPSEIEPVIEEHEAEASMTPENRPPIPRAKIVSGDHFINILFCRLPCYQCLRGLAKNIELCLIFPLNLFLAFYHLITVFKYDSFCLDCNPKTVVFGIENVTMTGKHFYASDFTHLSLCSTVITCTLGCAMFLYIFRHWTATLFYGAVMLTLATLCLVIRFYFIGAYFLFVSIVVLLIAALRFFGVIVSKPVSTEAALSEERRIERQKAIERSRQENMRLLFKN